MTTADKEFIKLKQLNKAKMAAKALPVQPSRFALLKIEDDDDDDSVTSSQPNGKQDGKGNQQPGASKKKKKKRKGEGSQTENAELRNLAFGGNKPKSSKGNQQQHQHGPPTAEQWEQWKKTDSEFTSETYEKDLQEALLQSKLAFEKEKLEGSKTGNDVDSGPHVRADRKKKKQKDKPATMSLEEFNLHEDSKSEEVGKSQSHDFEEPKTRIATEDGDTKFFNTVDSDASKIILKEKIQAEYTKQYIAENARAVHYEKEISKKDKELVMLRATMKNMDEELKEVKKRNKQLCHILAQGEMRDKAEVLMTVEQLTQVKDELTEQVTDLMAELEKERSKVHALKQELEKYEKLHDKHEKAESSASKGKQHVHGSGKHR